MKVLVAMDGEPFAKVIAEFVCNHLWPVGTLFRLVHVSEEIKGLKHLSGMGYRTGGFDIKLNDYLELISKELPHVEVQSILRRGDPVNELMHECRTWKPDLVIVGSHGAGFPERKLLGSVSHALVNHLDCSSIIVRVPSKILEEMRAKAAFGTEQSHSLSV